MVCNPNDVMSDLLENEELTHEESEELSQWAVVDTATGHSYLCNKSFKTEAEAHIMRMDLLKYHMHTEWANRLQVMPYGQIKKRAHNYDFSIHANSTHKCKPMDQRKSKEKPKDINPKLWL